MKSRAAAELVTKAARHAGEAALAVSSAHAPAESVHRARKHIKRARSILRALRPLAPEAARRAGADLRVQAHALAPLRDIDAFETAAAAVGAAGRPKTSTGNIDLTLIARALDRDRAAIAALPVAAAGRRFAREAVEHAYRQARRAVRANTEAPGEDTLHEARKRVKDCLHLVEAMGLSRPKGAPPKPGKLEALGETMGEIRDLDLVAADLVRRGATIAKRQRLASRRKRLVKDAARLAEAAFRRKPKAVGRAWR